MIAEESCSNLDISFCSSFVHDSEVYEEEEHVEQPSAVISQIPEVFPKVTDPSPPPPPPDSKMSARKRKREDSDVNDLISSASTALLKVQEVENNTEVLFRKYVASSL